MDVDVDVDVEGMEGIIKESDAVIPGAFAFCLCTPVCGSRGHTPTSSPPSAPLPTLLPCVHRNANHYYKIIPVAYGMSCPSRTRSFVRIT
jgi:hypothetical protein